MSNNVEIKVEEHGEGRYLATSPQFPGCAVTGPTAENVETTFRSAVVGYFAVLMGDEPPSCAVSFGRFAAEMERK